MTFCKCAQSDCNSGGFCDPDSDTFVLCDACGRSTCIHCQVPYHAGRTCEEDREDRAEANRQVEANREQIERQDEADATREAEKAGEERKSEKHVEKTTKACPDKKCGARIQKNGGCNHMTCTLESSYSHTIALLILQAALIPYISFSQILTSHSLQTGGACQHEFCWLCLANWSVIDREGNHYHATSCRFYAPYNDLQHPLPELRERRRILHPIVTLPPRHRPLDLHPPPVPRHRPLDMQPPPPPTPPLPPPPPHSSFLPFPPYLSRIFGRRSD